VNEPLPDPTTPLASDVASESLASALPDNGGSTAVEAATGSEAGGVWHVGDVILDLYEVKHVHHSGGMGIVYRLHHRGWGVDLALKSPRPERVADDRAKALFEQEAATWIRLGLHPYTVSCYYVRRIHDMPHIFAEYVEGGSLSEWIRDGRLYGEDPARNLARILDIAIQVAWGLQHAHANGLVHQDVKPGNVLVSKRGVAKVTDFGLAKSQLVSASTPVDPADPTDPAAATVEDGTILVSSGGLTPGYCSPEQARGQGVSRKTDVWSWGVSFLEMVLGKICWRGGSVADAALADYLRHGAPGSRVAHLPTPVAQVLREVFRRDPDVRLGNMLEIANVLRNAFATVTGQDYPRREPAELSQSAGNLNNRAISLIDLGAPREAHELWHQALVVQAKHPESTYNRGLTRWRAGELAGADFRSELRELCAANPDDWMPGYLVALAQLEDGELGDAVQTLQHAVAAHPAQPELAELLAEAEQRLNFTVGPERILADYGAHTCSVTAICVTPDGRSALSGSGDGAVRVWDLDLGRLRTSLDEHRDLVATIVVSRDGTRALTASADGTAKLWDLAAGQCLQALVGHSDRVTCAALVGDDGHALTGSSDSTLRLWDLRTGRLLQTMRAHEGPVHALAVAPDGRSALSSGGSADGHSIVWWDLNAFEARRVLVGHRQPVVSLALRPDGTRVASGSQDGVVRIWQLDTGECLHTLAERAGRVTAVCFGPDGHYLFCGYDTGTLQLWSPGAAQPVRRLGEGHDCCTAAALSADGVRLVTGHASRAVKVWRLDCYRRSPLIVSRVLTGEHIQAADRGHESALDRADAAWKRGDFLTAAHWLGQARAQPGYQRRPEAIRCWTSLYRTLFRTRLAAAWEASTLVGHRAKVTCLAVSADGRTIASGSSDRTVRLWDVQTTECLQQLQGHRGTVTMVRFSDNGKALVSAAKDGDVRIWHPKTGKVRSTLAGHAGAVRACALSADGLFVLSGGADGTLRLWDAQSGKCLRRITAHKGPVHAVCWTLDERRIVSGGGDGTIALWNAVTNELLRRAQCLAQSVASASLTPNGMQALAGGRDKHLVLWDWKRGKAMRKFGGHRDRVACVRLTDDGRHAVSASWDGTVRFWDVATGDCLRTFEHHESKVNAVAVSPDAGMIASGGDDRTIRIWHLDWDLDRDPRGPWSETARPWLRAFLRLHTPYAEAPPQFWITNRKVARALARVGTPIWHPRDLESLRLALASAGYGRPALQEIHAALEDMRDGESRLG
jgi:WD40 repeat protein/serine/threonine protein kinase